jgi:hypothetical protein
VTIEAALAQIGRVTRRAPYAYSTSWPIEEVELVRPDGSELKLLVKRTDGSAGTKPAFLVDRAREAEAYALLERHSLGTPRCYANGCWWLVLEKVPGVELWQRGDLEAWQGAADWAATLHATFAGATIDAEHLLRHDERFYRRWVERARARVGPAVDPLRLTSELAIARLGALPTTLIHGELYPSNILVAEPRVAVVDWEMAALGPAVIDLAALLTGWGPTEQEALIAAYGPADRADIAAAELLLALQWLGWGEGWDPPREHRRDWLSEARAAAEWLG